MIVMFIMLGFLSTAAGKIQFYYYFSYADRYTQLLAARWILVSSPTYTCSYVQGRDHLFFNPDIFFCLSHLFCCFSLTLFLKSVTNNYLNWHSSWNNYQNYSVLVGSCVQLPPIANGSRTYNKAQKADGSYPSETSVTNSCNYGYKFKHEVKSQYCSPSASLWMPLVSNLECIEGNLINEIFTYSLNSLRHYF